ncbi:MAG: exodeoxyribonuclease VII large subunit, partial [Planctomycetaceae bacterium]
QGAEAPPQIAAALNLVGRIPGVDLVLCGRGGGSLEDLWAFNTEVVARAIHACPVPVISAVGHEVDVTIADWVADVRAATPTEAAELAVPDQAQIAAGLERYAARLRGALHNRLQGARQRLGQLASRRMWTRPHELLHSAARRVDELEERQRRAVARH